MNEEKFRERNFLLTVSENNIRRKNDIFFNLDLLRHAIEDLKIVRGKHFQKCFVQVEAFYKSINWRADCWTKIDWIVENCAKQINELKEDC